MQVRSCLVQSPYADHKRITHALSSTITKAIGTTNARMTHGESFMTTASHGQSVMEMLWQAVVGVLADAVMTFSALPVGIDVNRDDAEVRKVVK